MALVDLLPVNSFRVGLLLGGKRRQGRDRLHLWRVAAGSADEVVTALRVAEALRFVQPASIQPVLAGCDQVLAITWKLTH